MTRKVLALSPLWRQAVLVRVLGALSPAERQMIVARVCEELRGVTPVDALQEPCPVTPVSHPLMHCSVASAVTYWSHPVTPDVALQLCMACDTRVTPADALQRSVRSDVLVAARS